MTLVDPCRRCEAFEATADVWNVPMCSDCFADWGKEAPTSGEVEAKAKPEHFEFTCVGVYMAPLRQLKPGLLEAYYRKWTAAWVAQRRLELGRGAA